MKKILFNKSKKELIELNINLKDIQINDSIGNINLIKLI